MKSPPDVALYLYGTELDPLVITQIIGVKPTKSWRRGERIAGEKSGSEFTAKIGLWMLKSTSRSKELSDHLHELLTCLNKKRLDKIEHIKGVQHAKIDVYLLPESGEDATLSLDGCDLLILGQLGLRLDLTAGCLSGLDK